LLPFLEENRLYKEFKLDEPWDGPNNKRLGEKTPRCYRPVWPNEEPGMTRFQVLVGPGTAFEGRDGLSFGRDFPDGLDATLLVVQAADAAPWSKPDNLAYDPAGPLPALGRSVTKEIRSGWLGKKRVAGFVACFANGQSRFVRGDLDEATLRAVITRNGGEKIDLSRLQ
jgi:hypothetical protein